MNQVPLPKPMILPTLKNPFSQGREIRRVEGNYQKPVIEQPRSIDNEPIKQIAVNDLQASVPQPIAQPPVVQISQPLPQEPVKKKRGRPAKEKAVTGKGSVRTPYLDILKSPQLPEEIQRMMQPEWQREADWKGKDLCILFPVGKTTNPATTWVLLALALDLGPEKMRADMELGDAMIYHSRNKLADNFLKTGCTWALWIDDDIIPPIGRAGWFKEMCGLPSSYPDQFAGMHVAHRLMSHAQKGVKLAGGLYFGRKKIGKPMFYEGQVNNEAYEAAMSFRDEIRPTEWVGTGCMLVHRDVFLDIQKKFPDLAPTQRKPYWDYFKPAEVDGEGEDIAFCRRAKLCGHQPYVDLGLKCMHLGWCAWGGHNVKNYLGGI